MTTNHSSARRLGALLVLGLLAALLVTATPTRSGADPGLRAAPPRLTLTVRGPLEIRRTLTVRGVFRPARAGRPWRLERRVAGTWRLVRTGRQPRTGVVTTTVRTPRTPGRFAVRLTAPAWRGQRALSRTTTVTLRAVPVRRAGSARLVTVGRAGTGGVGDRALGAADVSDGGRWVVFASESTTLVPGPQHGTSQVYLRDTVAGTTALVSSTPGGQPALGGSYRPVISRDGRLVVFESDAGDLVPGDTNESSDVFVFDRVTGALDLLSRVPGPLYPAGQSTLPCLSPNGRYVGYTTDNDVVAGGPTRQVVRLDRRTGTLTTVSRNADGQVGDGYSVWCRVSDDGSVVFRSTSGNFAPGDTENTYDLFLRRPGADVVGLTLRTPDTDYFGGGHGYDLTADGRTVFLVSGSQLLPEDTDQDWDLYRFVVDDQPGLELLEIPGRTRDVIPSADGTRLLHPYEYEPPTQNYLGPLVPRVTEPATGLAGVVAVLPDGTETADYDGTEPVGFSPDGTAVLFTSADPDLVGRPTGGVPQLLLQRLEPLG